jgi:site-specific DNA recombinase
MNDQAQPPRAVLYVRLSKASDVSTSIQGQNDELYALSQREGWTVTAVFEDNGRSGGKTRANAEEALRMLRDDEADVLAVYSDDRWSRMGIPSAVGGRLPAPSVSSTAASCGA